MSRFALVLCLVLAGIARAASEEPAPMPHGWPLDQVIYKGVAGNLLDSMPIEPDARVNLQRANAVISNPFSWRSFGLLMGIANPAFLVGGLAWGLWSAANIEAPKPDTRWLGVRPRDRVGFCSRVQESCRLPLPHESDREQARPGPTAMVTAD
jgi:hypothetical protein